MLGSVDNNFIRHLSVNACLAPLCSMHGVAVTTVEGIGNIKNGLHPVQVSFSFVCRIFHIHRMLSRPQCDENMLNLKSFMCYERIQNILQI